MPYSIKDAKAVDVQKNNYGNLQLVFSHKSSFNPLVDSTDNVGLFNKDDASRKITETQLRTAFGDDSITFSGDIDNTDETDIVNYVKTHKGAPIKEIIKNNKGWWTFPFAGGSPNGGSRYLKKFKDGDGVKYDPNVYVLPFDKAIAPSKMAEWNAKTGPDVVEAANGTKALTLPVIIDHAIFTNSFWAGKDIRLAPVSRLEFVKKLGTYVNKFNDGKLDDIQNRLKDVMDQLKDPKTNKSVSLESIISIFGGFSLYSLKDFPGAKGEIEQEVIGKVPRQTLKFYVKDPETGRIFETTSFNMNYTNRDTFFMLEYLNNDFVQADAGKFLDFLDRGKQSTEVAKRTEKDLGVKIVQDNGALNFDTPEKVLGFINHALEGHTATVKIDISRKVAGTVTDNPATTAGRKITEFDLDGSGEAGKANPFSNQFSDNAKAEDEPEEEKPAEAAPKDESANDPFGAKPATPTDPFGTADAKAAPKSESENPFADNNDGSDSDDPFGGSSDAGNSKSDNPFV